VSDALSARTVGKRRLSSLAFAVILVGVFLTGYLGARMTGVWANDISDQEYVDRIQEIHSPAYGHPGM
jgi:hypothetical protein